MTDEEYEDELLAPPNDVIAEPAPVVEDPADQAESEWHPSHGFPDSRTAVRVWVDDESREPTRIHVSPRWREVLGTNRSLDDAFREAFFAASVTVGGADPFLPQPVDPDAEGEPRLTREDLPHLRERIMQLSEHMNELRQRAPQEVRWADLQGDKTRARRGPATVTLSLERTLESVELDRTWLIAATPEQIEAAVLQAARAAFDQYVAPEFIPGEYEELALDFERAERDLTSIMAKGI